MFDFVRNNKKFIQIVLAIVLLPFTLWGVDSYIRSSSGNDNVATVGESPISVAEFQQALRERQDELRPQLGGASPEMLDSPQLRHAVLEELINRRLLQLFASESHLRISDEVLAAFIAAVPALQENGKFSRQRYEALVAAQGMSIEMFEARVRQDLLMQQMMLAAGNAALPGRLPADNWIKTQLEEREIREIVLRAEQFNEGIKPDADAVKRYYEENRSRFEKPEQVRVEYLVLDQAQMADSIIPTDAEIQAWYQANQTRYKEPEQRQASHILIRVDKNAAETEVKAAQTKAEQLLAQIKANPADFAKLAKQHSQDPGSADKGGDLGFFGRGMMVKPFEDSAFSLKEGEVSGLVRSDFGFHLIKVTAIRPERLRPLDEVRGEIAAELKRQNAAKRFAEAAEGFANTVYEQPDSLKPAAEKYGLKLQTSDWLTKSGQAMPPFSHPKLIQAIFSEDASKNRRNTEAIDVGNNTLVAARVIEHRPAAVEPLEAVADAIEKVLAREAATAKAVAAGQAQLEKLVKGDQSGVTWGTPRSVSRMHAPNLVPAARDAIFAVAVHKLPAFTGVGIPGGYALYRIDKIKDYDGSANNETQARVSALRQHYGQVVAQEEMLGWLAALRQRYPVNINSAALERK